MHDKAGLRRRRGWACSSIFEIEIRILARPNSRWQVGYFVCQLTRKRPDAGALVQRVSAEVEFAEAVKS